MMKPTLPAFAALSFVAGALAQSREARVHGRIVQPAAEWASVGERRVKLTEDGGRILKGEAKPEACSPAHHVRPGLPPTVIFHGTEDKVTPFWASKDFAKKMKEAGNRCDLSVFEGRRHLFARNQTDRLESLRLADGFLRSLDWLD